MQLTSKCVERGHWQLHINQLQVLAEPVECHSSISRSKERRWRAVTVLVQYYLDNNLMCPPENSI